MTSQLAREDFCLRGKERSLLWLVGWSFKKLMLKLTKAKRTSGGFGRLVAAGGTARIFQGPRRVSD